MPNLPACTSDQSMEPVSRHLDNGLPVMLLSQPWLSHAALCLRVNAGSHDEPLAYPGLAHFLEHLLFLGGEGFTAEQRLMPFVQACGGHVNATTQARYTEYFCEVPAASLDGALARLLDMVAQPILAEVDQVREREVVHAEFMARGQDADTLLSAALGQVLAEGHRCAVFQAGNRDSLPVVEVAFQQALRAFHRAFYHAGNCQLSIVAPQPIKQLYALAQRHGRVVADAMATPRASPVPMLPWRAAHLRLNLPDAMDSLHLGFALDLPEASAVKTLALQQSWLLDESSGGLLAGLRERGLAEGLQVQVPYCHGGQALLLLSARGVASAPDCVALLLDWLAFVNTHADPARCLDSYLQIQPHRLRGMTPLALARYWQESSQADAETLSMLLQQLQEPLRRCVVTVDNGVLPDWPGAGFPLRMACAPALRLPTLSGCWQLPGHNPLLLPAHQLGAVLKVSAGFAWLPGPKAVSGQPVPMAAWHARCCFTEPLEAELLLGLAQVSLREVRQHLAQLGINLTLDAEAASLSVCLQGSASLLPRAIALLMPALLHADAAHWRSAVESAALERQAMPIRQLLANCSELFRRQPIDNVRLDLATLQQRYRQVHVEALGVGLDACEQQQVEALFSAAHPLPVSAGLPLVASGQHWRTLAAEGESALLLFCPQPDDSALTEACWRVLGHLHQGAFYQRLRSELQLGYAVFCSYRQIQGRRGLLFGVQSPSCNGAAIVEHIQAFLQERNACLRELNQAALACATDALSRQWQVQSRSCEGLAEHAWQAHLAGLSAEHDDTVQLALQQLDPDAVLQAQQALSQAVGGWYVLSNQAPPR